MLLIPCPNCGERDESEFDYGGRALDLPQLDSAVGDWHRALHLRTPAEGPIAEYWYHAAGCECWISLYRDPGTHEFHQRQPTVDGDTD